MFIGLSEQIRNIDRLTAEKFGRDSLKLMYNAAKSVFDVISEMNATDVDICILCGKGNNAGDGFALADMLSGYCKTVTVVLLCGKKFTSDATYYFERIPSTVQIVEDEFIEADIYVDAVFGTGFHGQLPSNVSKLFSYINQSKAKRIAIDVPSGVNSDTGVGAIGCFHADICVTFEILKFCHVLPDSKEFCGKVIVRNIGLSPEAIQEVGLNTYVLDNYSLPLKKKIMHKGVNGSLYAVVGCKRYQGAASLSIQSALRGGCGLVTAIIPESIYVPLASKINSAIMVCCAENKTGTLSCDVIDKLVTEIHNRKPTAILAGSGLGISDDIDRIIDFVLAQQIPCVIDGDGLRYVSTTRLSSGGADTILTPHMGEFSRMCGESIESIKDQRFALCKEYAKNNRVTLVLKDAFTVITSCDGEQWILSEPNPALAKGGSGDVLAGLISSFLAQGFSATEAAKAGVYFHSAAAKAAMAHLGTYAMLPEDIIKRLSDVDGYKI